MSFKTTCALCYRQGAGLKPVCDPWGDVLGYVCSACVQGADKDADGNEYFGLRKADAEDWYSWREECAGLYGG